MPLHHSLAYEPPSYRRLRRWTPLLLVAGLTALALAPGRIAGDRSFQASICGDLEQAPQACSSQLLRTVLAAMGEREPELSEAPSPVPQ